MVKKSTGKTVRAFSAEWNSQAERITESHREAVAKLLAAFGEPKRHTVFSADRDETFVFAMANDTTVTIRVTW